MESLGPDANCSLDLTCQCALLVSHDSFWANANESQSLSSPQQPLVRDSDQPSALQVAESNLSSEGIKLRQNYFFQNEPLVSPLLHSRSAAPLLWWSARILPEIWKCGLSWCGRQGMASFPEKVMFPIILPSHQPFGQYLEFLWKILSPLAWGLYSQNITVRI